MYISCKKKAHNNSEHITDQGQDQLDENRGREMIVLGEE